MGRKINIPDVGLIEVYRVGVPVVFSNYKKDEIL
jgi:hypothetical protein